MNENINENIEVSDEIPHIYPDKRLRFGSGISIFGFLVTLLGAKPGFFGMDRSPVIGFIQIATFVIGIGIIALGGYITLMSFWPKNSTTITADFGVRFVLTGYAITVFCGMADVFGFGTHPITGVPFFGHLQATGVEIGELVIGLGLIMMIIPKHSSLRVKKEDSVERIDMTK